MRISVVQPSGRSSGHGYHNAASMPIFFVSSTRALSRETDAAIFIPLVLFHLLESAMSAKHADEAVQEEAERSDFTLAWREPSFTC